jgi:hypothetical protein
MEGQPQQHAGSQEARRWGVPIIMFVVSSLVNGYFGGPTWVFAAAGALGTGLVLFGYFPQLLSWGYWNHERMALSVLAIAPVGLLIAIWAATAHVYPLPVFPTTPSVPTQEILSEPWRTQRYYKERLRTPRTPLDTIQDFLRTRTVVYMCPNGFKDGLWLFTVEHMGDNIAVNNVEVSVNDPRRGLLSGRTMVSGMNVNPEPGVPHFRQLFTVPYPASDDQAFNFFINDSKTSAMQELRVQTIERKRRLLASRVIDARTHEVLLACKDAGISGLDKSWDRVRLPECESIDLFRINAVVPERTNRFP